MGDMDWNVRVFGGGLALSSRDRDNTYFAVEAGSACWLIDCGGSPFQNLLRADLAPGGLRGILLTHSHADHLYGLPLLLFQLSLAGFDRIVPIYGLVETLSVAQRIVEAFSLDEHCVAHRWCIVTVAEGERVAIAEENGLEIQVARVRHSRPTLGVRLEGGDGGVIAYSADTEPCQGVVELAWGAHWLVHECTVDQPMFGHSTPEDVGAVAKEAGVGAVGLVHYDGAYGVSETEVTARVERTGFRGPVHVLRHLDRVWWQWQEPEGQRG